LVATVLGGLLLAGNLWATLGNLRVAQRTLETNREDQITQRFARAIEFLGATDDQGHPALEKRIGGVYALEGMARDHDNLYSVVIEVLTAYLRHRAPWHTEPTVEPTWGTAVVAPYHEEIQALLQENEPFRVDELARFMEGPIGDAAARRSSGVSADFIVRMWRFNDNNMRRNTLGQNPPPLPGDVQAILSVLGRRARWLGNGEERSLDLSRTDLRFADLRGFHLEGARLVLCNMTGALLQGAQLESADFEGTILDGAVFDHATRMSKAKIDSAASFIGTEFRATDLRDTDLATSPHRFLWIVRANDPKFPPVFEAQLKIDREIWQEFEKSKEQNPQPN
jgi:hypothetical protein